MNTDIVIAEKALNDAIEAKAVADATMRDALATFDRAEDADDAHRYEVAVIRARHCGDEVIAAQVAVDELKPPQ